MKISVGANSDVGRVRQGNEDSYLTKEPLYVVADGMGGHLAGEVASATAVDLISAQDGVGPEDLVELVERANTKIYEKAQSDPSLKGMGTTFTLVLVEDSTAHVAHVGDSRAYLLRDEVLEQITKDHTLVARLVREGRITAEEAQHHPQRSIITRALGVDASVRVDLDRHQLQNGDRLLICSDGLSSMLESEELQQTLLSEGDPQRAADLLVQKANEAGGEDNITVIVLDVSEAGKEETKTSAAPAPSQEKTPADEGSPRSGSRILLALSVLALLAGFAWFALQYALNNLMWFVGADTSRNVAIFHGVPDEIGGLTLSELEESSDLSVDELPEFVRDDVLEGHRVDSLEEARQYIENLRDRAADFRAPSPTPQPTRS